MLNLDQVTLLGIDCVALQHLIAAAEHCTSQINFGAVKLLSSIPSTHPNVIHIPAIKSQKEYNHFCIKEMANYFDTDFVLNIEWDGYVLDASKWTDDFLEYDYIGATWWYKDNMNVGNGGFSLRSKKLQQILRDDKHIVDTYPEDHMICRKYRPYLEKYYDIKFSPDEVANKFSIEAAYSKDRKYNGAFGWHGHCVDFSQARLKHIPKLRIKE